MRVQIKAFASAREALGQREIWLELAPGATLSTAWRELCERHPRLAGLPLAGLAVNRTLAEPETALADGDEVAILPPVSGG